MSRCTDKVTLPCCVPNSAASLLVMSCLFQISLGFETIKSVGASGAIFGMVGAWATFCLMNESVLGRDNSQRALRNVAQTVMINVVYGMNSAQIDNMAHLGVRTYPICVLCFSSWVCSLFFRLLSLLALATACCSNQKGAKCFGQVHDKELLVGGT